MSATTIKAHFKQYTGKGGAANLQFEVLTSASGFYDAIKLAGQTVVLTIETEQQELDLDACEEYEIEPLPLDDEPIERPANVDAETGEIYDPIEDGKPHAHRRGQLAMRYFEDNIMSGVDMHDLHDNLHKAAGVVESNIVFMLTHDADETRSADVDMCQSAYNTIAICEAIIAKYNEDVAEKALANARSDMQKLKERRDELKAVLGILLGGC